MIPIRLIIFVHVISEVFCNNIDWKHATIYYGGSDTAFGYSLIMSGGSKPWIQIGDPLGQPDGVIWRCPFKEQCSELHVPLLDPDQSLFGDIIQYEHHFFSNSTFLGGAMDVLQEDSVAKQSIVCAPGFKYQIQRWTKKRTALIPGACFWREENCTNCNEIVLKPFLNSKYLYEEIHNYLYNFYSLAEGGFSTQIIKIKDSTSLQVLMGAPGLFTGKGGLALGLGKPVLSRPSQRRKRQSDEIIIDRYQVLYADSGICYLGYKVNYGYFFEDRKITYIASAPRCYYSGMVYLIKKFGDFDPAILMKSHIHSTLTGTEIGELFGATILVIRSEINKYDELIIGSPFHSQDFGAVYYYNSDGHSLNLLSKYVGFSIGGRFGDAMICLGKQDLNGYQDVAIAAPLEDDRRGAIYIFRVGNNDFRQLQRIAARDIDLSFRGFGHALAEVDIDANGYSDLGVGSYTGHVVILRSRPIIEFKLNLESEKKILQHNDANLIVSAFVEFTGTKPPPYITLNISISVDERLKRAHLKNSQSRTERITNLALGKKEKYDFKITIMRNENFNYIEPLQVNIHVETVESPAMMNESYTWILHNSNWGIDTFCSSCPVWTEMDAEKKFPFTLMCENNNQCKTDLYVNASFLNITSKNPFVIGSHQDLILNINIRNLGEPAYLTELIVRYKEPIKLQDNPVKCHSFSSSSNSNFTAELICTIANPLWNNTHKSLTIPFDPSFVKHSFSDLWFEVEVFSKSLETNPKNNVASVKLPLAEDIQLVLSGSVTPSKLLFERHLPSTFSHSFMIQNEGVSTFEKASIQINLPTEWIDPLKRKINFLKIFTPKMISFNDNLISKRLNCTSEIEYIKATERRRRSTDDQKINSTNANMFTNRTIIMDCQNPNIVCKTIVCIIGPFSSKILIRVDVEIEIDIPIIIPILGKKDIIQFFSEAGVKVEEPERYKTLKPLETKFINFIITLTGLPPKEFVETWIIALAAIGGLLFLLIFSSGLVKAGFFERKKKEQLMMLKQEEEIEFQKRHTILEEDTQYEEFDQDL